MTADIKIQNLQIVMGNLCNQECNFCYQHDRSNRVMLDEEIWKNKLTPIYRNLQQVNIIGGEPTIIKNARELAHYLSENFLQIRFNMITNGKVVDSFWRELFIERGNQIFFSINAATKHTYDQVVRRGNFESVIANLETLVAERNRRNRGLKVHAGFVITEQNHHEMVAFMLLCQSKGIKRAVFTLDFNSDNRVYRQHLTENLLAAKEHAPKVASLEVYGLDAALASLGLAQESNDHLDDSYHSKICSVPWSSAHVSSFGDLSFCCSAWLPLGNLHDKSVHELWNGRIAQQMRKAISSGDYSMCKPSCAINVNPSVYNKKLHRTMLLKRALYFAMVHPKETLAVLSKRLFTKGRLFHG